VPFHPEETAKWNVVYDARGHLVEPHVRHQVALGTLEVRSYIRGWNRATPTALGLDIDETYPTKGPVNRYKWALFIEKEGFDPLIARSGLTAKYDLAVFSSKGMSTTATRLLVDELAGKGVTVLIAHDFDLAGLTIAHTLYCDSPRYTFKNRPTVIDIGLRMADVKKMKQSEPVKYDQDKDPRGKFRERDGYDATEAELNFLVEGKPVSYRKGWVGQRVELNAMTSAQFVAWLERKLKEHGVTKVIPDKATLIDAWRHAQLIAQVKQAVQELKAEAAANPLKPPANLNRRVRDELCKNPEKSWDEVLVP